jgi:tRNA(fMet)-specific endonuclease VapC
MVVLDTDNITLLERNDSPTSLRLLARLDSLEADDIATTIVSYEEQTRGWLAYLAKAATLAAQINAYTRLKTHLRNYCRISVLDFDDNAALEYDRLRSARVRIGTMDLRIAAIVLTNDATLLSRNIGDFRRVPDLKVDDWTIS